MVPMSNPGLVPHIIQPKELGSAGQHNISGTQVRLPQEIHKYLANTTSSLCQFRLSSHKNDFGSQAYQNVMTVAKLAPN